MEPGVKTRGEAREPVSRAGGEAKEPTGGTFSEARGSCLQKHNRIHSEQETEILGFAGG